MSRIQVAILALVGVMAGLAAGSAPRPFWAPPEPRGDCRTNMKLDIASSAGKRLFHFSSVPSSDGRLRLTVSTNLNRVLPGDPLIVRCRVRNESEEVVLLPRRLEPLEHLMREPCGRQDRVVYVMQGTTSDQAPPEPMGPGEERTWTWLYDFGKGGGSVTDERFTRGASLGSERSQYVPGFYPWETVLQVSCTLYPWQEQQAPNVWSGALKSNYERVVFPASP